MKTRRSVFAAYPIMRLISLAWALGHAEIQWPTVFAQELQLELTPTADLIVTNAKVWTGTVAKPPTPDQPEPTAVVVVDGKFAAVGDSAIARAFIGPATKIVNAQGRRIIPGLTDSHTHLISGGFQLDRLDLRSVKSKEEFVETVAKAARSVKKGDWLLGGRWSVESWDKPESPTRFWIDSVTNDIPVLLDRMDGHGALANTAALKLAGIDVAGPSDPAGGEIERDPKSREPTGILKDSAIGLVSRLKPEPTPQQRYEALQRAIKHANAWGITSVHDLSEWADLDAYRRAEQDNALTVRVTSYLQIGDWTNPVPAGTPGVSSDKGVSFIDYVAGLGAGSEKFRVAGFKLYMDGSLGSRNAFMREPFADATPEMKYPHGQLTQLASDVGRFQRLINAADAKGLQIAVHAIGDEGNHRLLDAYENARRMNGRSDARHRDEHTQHLHVSDIPRFAKFGVVASMQPYHKADDGRYAEKALGKGRLAGSYAFRQLVDAGALVIFGSDWPVVTMNPFAGIDSAVNARTLAGDIWLPAHSLTLAEALYAYTAAPPKAVHREKILGSIEPGKLADFVILADDPFTIATEKIGEIKPWRTVVAGNIVYTMN